MLSWQEKYDSWRAFVAPLLVWVIIELLDVDLTLWVTSTVAGITEGNTLMVHPATGLFLVAVAIRVKLLAFLTVLLPLSLAAYAGTRSWLLASLPFYWGIFRGGLVLFDNLVTLL
jgi:hypothetical protein